MNIGFLYIEMKRGNEAIQQLESALEKCKQIYGLNHPYTASAFTSLADANTLIKNYSKANDIYDQASKILLKYYGKDHFEYFINQLRNWVEGPKLIGFTEHLQTLQNLTYSILDDVFIKPSFLRSGLNQIDLLVDEKNPFIFTNTKEQFDQLSAAQKKVTIVLINDGYQPHEIIGNHGWMVNPGHEEITGICDFDVLDALLDGLINS
jgi:tetratricopeptide (TPR) repeat protein